LDQRHQEYIEYYQSRLKKYENNPLYPNSYQSEKALYDAIANASDIEESGKIVESENLAVKNAIALVKDQETARKKHYEELKEYIRLHAPERILDKVDSVETDLELVKMVNDIESEVSIEIIVDLFTQEIYNDLMMLEEIEVYQSAEVPDEWKNEINHQIPQEMIEEGVKDWKESFVPNARNWDPNWQYNASLIWEERHRRVIPIPDEILEKRIKQFKTYRGI
jgi:hypothetical protein